MQVHHLDELLGAHPEALRAIYSAGRAPDTAELCGSWWGRFLAVEQARDVAALMRPVVRALRGGDPLWQGKTFFADGTGINHMLGGRAVRLGVEPALSLLDGAATTSFRYDMPQHKNIWPVRNVYDELRMVGRDIAIGPAFISATAGGPRHLFLWFGLQREA